MDRKTPEEMAELIPECQENWQKVVDEIGDDNVAKVVEFVQWCQQNTGYKRGCRVILGSP